MCFLRRQNSVGFFFWVAAVGDGGGDDGDDGDDGFLPCDISFSAQNVNICVVATAKPPDRPH